MGLTWQLVVLFWAWSPLCFSSTVSFTGSPEECEYAHFVPGYNLGGEGFDIVTMQRKGAYVIDIETWNLGNDTCRMYKNSHMMENQKVPAAVVDWRALPKCTMKVASELYNSIESLVKDSTSSVSNNWKLGLDIPESLSGSVEVAFGGSQSRASQFGIEKSKEDHYTFVRHSVDCSLYLYKLTTNPPMSRDFLSAVNSLPPYSSAKGYQYRNLIDTYGTHYITQVSLGGGIKTTTAIKTCYATMNGLTATDVSDCLSVETSTTFANAASDGTKTEDCQAKRQNLGHSFSSEFSEQIKEVTGGNGHNVVFFEGDSDIAANNRWLDSLKYKPDVIQYNLTPLHTILPNHHFARSGLKVEVERYIKKNGVRKLCSEPCQIGHRSNKRDPCACVCESDQNVKSNCCPAGKGLATLTVLNLSAKNLYGDVWGRTDGFVQVKYGDQTKHTDVIVNNDYPTWFETFEFGNIVIKLPNKLTFSVYDQDPHSNDLLGQCSFDLHEGFKSDRCDFDYGTFLFSYEVKCAPSLGGSRCDNYVPSPMNPSVAQVFYTRNGVLFGNS